MTEMTLHLESGHPRADSRHLAAALGHQHKNLLGLLGDYEAEFAVLGTVAFETRALPGGGLPQRWAYLTEDQCYFLLTLVRNSDLVVKLKLGLVQAFRLARETAPVLPALPTDPLDLLALSLQGLQQQRSQIQALEQANIRMEQRLDTQPVRVNSEMRARLHAAGSALGRVHPRSFRGGWSAFKEAFGFQGAPLAAYDDLPMHRFDEAMSWLDLQTRTFAAQGSLLAVAGS